MYHIPLAQIEAELGFNVRYDYGDIEGLAKSIVENGVKNPIRVTKVRGESTYVLTDGHRRFQALKYAYEQKWIDSDFKVPALLMEKGATEVDRVAGLIIYNDGKSLTLLEEAEVYSRLIELGKTQTQISTMVGKTTAHVSNLMMLLTKTSETLKEKIKAGTVSASLVIQELKSKSSEEIESEINQAVKKHGIKTVTKKHMISPKKQALDFLKSEGYSVDNESDLISLSEVITLMIKFKKIK